MANRYWVGNGGTWDASDTAHWSLTSGGTPGASAPTSSDRAIFDANSFTTTGQTVTYNSSRVDFIDIDFTGVLNNPTFELQTSLYFKKDLIFVTDMTFTHNSNIVYFVGGDTGSIVSAGKTLYRMYFYGSSSSVFNFLDDITISNSILFGGNYIKLNGHTLTVSFFANDLGGLSTLDITNSTVVFSSSITSFGMPDTTNFVLVATGSTIIYDRPSYGQQFYCASTGGNPLHFGTVIFNTGSGEISVRGSNTFDKLIFNAGRTVKFRAGDTITVGEIKGNGTSANKVTIFSSDADTPFTISKSSGRVSVDHWDIKDCHVTGGASFYAGLNSIDSGGNDGWIWDEPSGVFLTAEQDGPDIVLNWEE